MELDMSKRMLIDASHPEESRVAILNNDRLEEFDFETTTKKQFKGNIYLAKVIRIEPSLQAAFVEFGGNRHGFLAFNEIHPDYYRIPIEDREALMAQTAEEHSPAADDVDEEPHHHKDVEILGGEDVEEIEERPQRPRPSRQYKIQEVIKRRQIMLIQVTKEERGGKGAALTTYLSLAGRYCVLMPNAAKGGGISRKITSAADRKRLREIIESIELPETMSLIIRTAGMARSKIEIRRDSDYLMRLWNDIREKTLHSIAPALIYEESDLIKRAIRDYYARDIDEIWIEGEEGFKEAKEFIRKLMPSHIKKVKQYADERIPLFYRYGVEQQIDAMHNPIVQLKSGGYIVFGTTEALVAIDVNSGRATRERHIEETAFKTNVEAAEEIARQLRLRDLAGLVVIDFIDMEDNRNVETVERRLKDAMRHDRARVQVGRISPFGLLELSRQRLRPNIIESTSHPCQACRGSGMIRSVESASLHVLRGIEEEAIQQKVNEIIVYVPTAIALYILNQKRKALQDIETRWNLSVRISRDDALIPPDFRVERIRLKKDHAPSAEAVSSSLEAKEATGSESVAKEAQHRGPPRSRFGKHRRPERQAHAPQPHASAGTTEQASPTEISPEASTPRAEGETAPHKQPRRRYRKFNRKTHPRPEGSMSGESAAHVRESITSSSSLENQPPRDIPIIRQPAEVSPPPAKKEKTSSAKLESTPSQSTPPVQKKASTRKGWWQRLME